MLYTPQHLQGVGLKNLYVQQGIDHVCDIVDHIWKDDITGRFIQVSLENLRLELGINQPILNSDYDKYQHAILTNSWIVHTWKFMAENCIQLDIDAPVIPLRRERDAPLMETILNTLKLTRKEIQDLNKCRMYLQIFNISEIVTGDGKRITEDAWAGTFSNENRDLQLEWPQWPRPTEEKWRLWRYVIRQVLCTYKEKELDNPLGKWYGVPPGWSWFLYESNLLNKKDNKYYFH